MGNRCPCGGDRRHHTQYQPHINRLLQGDDRLKSRQRHRVFPPPQSHCLHLAGGPDRGKGSGVCRRAKGVCGLFGDPLHGRLQGTDGSTGNPADLGNRRTGYGESRLLLRQTGHRRRRRQRPGVYPPLGRCEKGPCVHFAVENIRLRHSLRLGAEHHRGSGYGGAGQADRRPAGILFYEHPGGWLPRQAAVQAKRHTESGHRGEIRNGFGGKSGLCRTGIHKSAGGKRAGSRPHPTLFYGKTMPGAGVFCDGVGRCCACQSH